MPKRKKIIEGQYVIIAASLDKAVGFREPLCHIEAAHITDDPAPEAFLGRIMIDTPREDIYEAAVGNMRKPPAVAKLRVKIEIEYE